MLSSALDLGGSWGARISPVVRAWIERHSRVPKLLDAADGATDDVDF